MLEKKKKANIQNNTLKCFLVFLVLNANYYKKRSYLLLKSDFVIEEVCKHQQIHKLWMETKGPRCWWHHLGQSCKLPLWYMYKPGWNETHLSNKITTKVSLTNPGNCLFHYSWSEKWKSIWKKFFQFSVNLLSDIKKLF